MLISVCMIVRNEEELLATALASVEGLADEVVIVDTGSVDGTVELARKFGARVILDGDRRHKGKARNRAQDAAVGEWVVVLDADERVADPAGVRMFLEGTAAQGVYVRLMCMDGRDRPTLSFAQLRCWRRGSFKYHYRAHEVPVAVAMRGVMMYTDFVWEHRPPAERWARKLREILEQLEADVAENPGDPRPLFYLGRQYVYCGEWEAAVATLKEYLEGQEQWDRGDAWGYLAQCYGALGREREQIGALHQACAEQPGRREWWGRLAGIYHQRGENELAVGLLRCALEIPAPARAYVTHWWYGGQIYDLLARCLWALERYVEGCECARHAVELEPDDERLKQNLCFFEEKVR